mgnify:CR=1 FL=1
MLHAVDAGLRVPDDIAVAGFDAEETVAWHEALVSAALAAAAGDGQPPAKVARLEPTDAREVYDGAYDSFLIGDYGLADIAPTMLQILGLPRPEEMTGRSILPQEQ